jgi:steroid delta-isomerase-like uncharacterized protein
MNAMQAKREAIVNEHIEAETIRRDVAATVETFKHPRYEVPALGTVADGAVAVTQLLGGLLTAFPDFHLESTQFRHAEDAVIVECRLVGTQRAVWAGIEPSGKKMDVCAACFFLFDRDELTCERVYFDQATVVRQLMPG